MWAEVFMLYEYLLTVGDERKLLWRCKVGASSFLFLANRVQVIVYTIAQFMRYSSTVRRH